MQKLVYILPEYCDDIGTHFYHNVEFLDFAQEKLDIFLIIEKGDFPKTIKHGYLQRFRFLPLRVLELAIVLIFLRTRGYRTIWTHYSFVGSIFGALIFKKSFYWNCGMPWLYRRGAVEEYFFRLALRRSDLVTGTEGMKKQYVEHYRLDYERVRVLPNWINLERYRKWVGKKSEARERLNLPLDIKIVLFLHRLSKRKGADMIVPVARAFENDKNILFLVAGSGPLEREIHGPNIRIAGEVAQRDVPTYLAAADIFFMPSEEEGFPHVLLEAMAIGVPIVASDVGGVREIVPDVLKDFITRQDATVFAQKIKILLSDTKTAQILAAKELEWVKKYSLDIVFADRFIPTLRV